MKERKLLFFTARYCGKCFAIKKRINKLIVQKQFNIDYEVIDVEKNKESIEKYKLEGVPTTIILEDGKEIKRVYGSLYMEDLIELVG